MEFICFRFWFREVQCIGESWEKPFGRRGPVEVNAEADAVCQSCTNAFPINRVKDLSSMTRRVPSRAQRPHTLPPWYGVDLHPKPIHLKQMKRTRRPQSRRRRLSPKSRHRHLARMHIISGPNRQPQRICHRMSRGKSNVLETHFLLELLCTPMVDVARDAR
jgi:hypothetical protein